MKRILPPLLILMVAIGTTGCVDRAAQERGQITQEFVTDTVRVVSVQPVRLTGIAETATITGEIVTSDDVQVGAKQSGRVVQVNVRDGDAVSAGQVVARLDQTSQRSQLQQAEANLASARSGLAQARQSASVAPSQSSAAIRGAEAQLRSARAQLDKALEGARPEERRQAQAQVAAARSNMETAKKELERTRTLVDEGAIPRSRLDQAQNAYQTSLAQYESALEASRLLESGSREQDVQMAREGVRQAEENLNSARARQRLDANLGEQVRAGQAAVQSAQAQVDLARDALAETEIRAPFAGRVSGSPVQPGTVVSPGTPVVRIIGGAGAYFEGEVPETLVARVHPGMTVAVTIGALPNRSFMGTVVAVSPSGQTTGRLFRVRISLVGDTAAIRPGMFAQGMIELQSKPSSLVVPESAVVRESGQEFVFVLQGDDTVDRVPVTVGVRSAGQVEVAGIPEGARVVVRGQEGLAEGVKVRVEELGRIGADPTDRTDRTDPTTWRPPDDHPTTT
jgi:HlyD family secretion protein